MKRPKHKIISINDLESVATSIFKQYNEIQLAYLYGSYAIGTQNEFSDIDLGIVLENSFKPSALYFARIASLIEEQFDYKIEIDLRILSGCTPRFLNQVIKYGKAIYSENKTFQYIFELKVFHQYLDIKPMLDMFDRISIKKVLENEY